MVVDIAKAILAVAIALESLAKNRAKTVILGTGNHRQQIHCVVPECLDFS